MKGNGSNGHNRLASAAIRFQPDPRLVRLVKEGHDLAFEEIVRRYRPQLVGFAGAIVPRDQAEDVVQEGLAKAHRALGRGDAEINLRPWLYTIVRNRALNALRDEPVHDHLDENYDGVPQPPDVAARREELAAVIAAVQGLPAPQREALVGRELEGRSHDEIAASLGTTPGAVRGLIYRARTTLRDGLGLLIPVPLLRALLGAGPAAPDVAGGAAAAGLAAGGGGIAVKAGATLGIAVIAVGSGLAIQHRSSNDGTQDQAQAAVNHARPSAVGRSAAVGPARGLGDGSRLHSEGPGDDSGQSSSSGPGSGHPSSDDGSGSGESGHGGSSGSGDDGGGSTTSGSGGGGDDGGGSGTSGGGATDGGGGSGTSGSGGNSGPGGGGETVGTDDGGGGDNSGPGGGDDGTTTTTTTTTSTSGGSGGPG